MAKDLRYTISGDARDFQRTLRSVDDSLGRSEKRFHRFGQVVVGALSAKVAGDFVGALVRANAESEASLAKLQSQLKATGASYKAHGAEIDRVIQKTANLAAVDDEDLQDAFTNILRVTGSVSKSLKLVGLAADIARAKQIPLAKAGELVGKVAGGNTGILARYGIQVDKNATSQEALATLQKKFAGQAEAYGKTTAGAQDRLRNSVENLEESMGKALAPTIEDLSNKAAKFVDQIRTGTGAGGKFRDAVEDIVDKVKPLAQFFKDHPKLIAVAVGAWATYKAASKLALAAIRVSDFRKVFAKSVPVAGEEGAAAGAAYAGGFDTTSSAGVRKAGKTGKLAGALEAIAAGGVVVGAGAAVGEAFAIALYNQADKVLRKKLGTLGDLLVAGFGGIPGQLGAMLNPTGTAGDLVPNSARPSILPTVGSAVQNAAKPRPSLPHSKVKTPKAPTITPGGKKPRKPRNTAFFMPPKVGTSRVKARAASGGTYSHDELMALWVQAGGPPEVADMAAAIALAESGGNPSIVNSIGATGLWQIHPGGSQYLDPMANARAAVAKYRGANNRFTPWTTYTGYDTPGHKPTYGQFLTGGAVAPGSSVTARARPRGASADSKARSAFQASRKRGRGAHSTATAAEVKRMTATYQDLFDLAMADADVLLADVDPANDIIAIASKGTTLQTAIKKIQKQLKSAHLAPQKRKELLRKLADLIGQLKDLGQQAIDLGEAPGPAASPLEVANSNVALAGLTPTKVDDLQALLDVKAILEKLLQEAKDKGDVAAITDLAGQLAGLNDNISGLQDTLKEQYSTSHGPLHFDAPLPPEFTKLDWANAALALAQLTPALQDDLAALNDIKKIDEEALKVAQDSQDPVAIAAAAQALASVQSEIANLNDTLKATATEPDAYTPGKYVPAPTDTRATGDVHVNTGDWIISNQVDANAVLNRLAFKIATA